MKYLQLFENFDIFGDDSDFIVDKFIDLADKWNLYELDPGRTKGSVNFKAEMADRLSKRENLYYCFISEENSKVNIMIVLLSDVSNIVHTPTSEYEFRIEDPKKYLQSEFVDDINKYVDNIKKYYMDEMDENDIVLSDHVRQMVANKSSSSEDIQKLMDFSRPIKRGSDKFGYRLEYQGTKELFVRENNPLYKFRNSDGSVYKFEVSIEFKLGKYKK